MTNDPFADLTPEEREQAEKIEQEILAATALEVRQMAALLASKQLPEVFGETEFQLRDHVNRIGAVSLEAAMEEKKNGIHRQ